MNRRLELRVLHRWYSAEAPSPILASPNKSLWGPCLLAIFLLALVTATAGCKRGSDPVAQAETPEAKPAAVEVATAVVQRVEKTVSATGTLAPGQGATARVAAVTAGRLVDVKVREGDRVVAGETLALVDSRPQQAQARSAAA